jgi:pimeloyl-ACP methyl ester carboxylesterase
MNIAIKIFLAVIKWILILIVFLFSIATLAGRSYLQTCLLWLLIVCSIWWPAAIRNRWNKAVSNTVRIILVLCLLVVSFTAFRPEPKSSIYLNEESRTELMGIYDGLVDDWPEGTESIYVDTKYGKVHVLACGKPEDPPLVMIHAASIGAHSWFENLPPLEHHYRVYSVDNIGEGNRSSLDDALVFPGNQEEVAEHLAAVLDSLGVERVHLFGASNGGFVAMAFADNYPERVESIALFGPMGLTPLTGKSIMMLSVATMYPFQFVRNRVERWALGNDPYVHARYGEWFNCIMKGTIPSVAKPVPMTRDQKSRMDFPVLLFLGTEDPIVGNAETARLAAVDFPYIRIEICDSGHLVAVEERERVNGIIAEFLKIR